jgi:predicted DNA-binding transcriptional regulator YafY
MGATILRQWLVLTMLPKPPRRIDTAAIEWRLRERGIDVHRRTIQRDLLELAEVFPIVADERAKPYGWRWSDDAKLLDGVPSPRPGARGAIDVALRIPKHVSLTEVLERLGAWNLRVLEEVTVANDSGGSTVVVAVEDSRMTRRLLLGHGDEVEVLTPLSLRREIAERARRALAMHGE